MLKIDCIPCQSDQLTGTKFGFKNQRVLLVIVWFSGCFKKFALFLTGEEFDVIFRTHRFWISNSVHRVLSDHIIHLGCFEHGSHGDISLPNGRACIVCIHIKKHLLAVHRFNIGDKHFTHNGLDIMFVPFPVISESIGSKIAHNVFYPEVKPLIDCHICRNKNIVVFVSVFAVFNPVARFGKCLKILLVPFSESDNKSCAVQTVFSLMNTFSTFLAFEVFAHSFTPFCLSEKSTLLNSNLSIKCSFSQGIIWNFSSFVSDLC